MGGPLGSSGNGIKSCQKTERRAPRGEHRGACIGIDATLASHTVEGEGVRVLHKEVFFCQPDLAAQKRS